MDGEMVLAEKFQVSRSSVREAMKALSLQNIVESKPGHGTFIATDALKKIANMELANTMGEDVSLKEKMELRILMEEQIVEWVTQNASLEEIERLEGVIQEDMDNIDFLKETLLQTRTRFHEELAEIAGNGLMVRLLRTIRAELETHRQQDLILPQHRWQEMMEEHQLILDIIRTRDVDRARETMRRHLSRNLEDILKNDRKEIHLEDTLLHM
jgi:GntR family transcriptional repressor for pyruvate dehydrogenase complex